MDGETRHVIPFEKPAPKAGAVLADVNDTGDWTQDLPPFEDQSQHGLETEECVSASLANVIDSQAKRQGRPQERSARFLAKVSGTGHGGNSYPAVWQALHDFGVCLRALWDWPATNPVTWDQYYADVPPAVLAAAKEFFAEWDVSEPQYLAEITVDAINAALKKSPVWFCNAYHSMMIYRPITDRIWVFDTEADATAGFGSFPLSYLPQIVAAANVQLTPKAMPTFDPAAFVAANDKKLIRYAGDGTLALSLQGKLQVVTEARAGFAAMAMLEYGIAGAPVTVTDPEQWKALAAVSVNF